MAANETTFNRKTLADTAKSLAADGGIAQDIHHVAGRRLAPPNIGANNYLVGGTVTFPAANDLMVAINAAYTAITTSTTVYGNSVHLMGSTLNAIGQTYDDASAKDKVSVNQVKLTADHLQQAINTAAKIPPMPPAA